MDDEQLSGAASGMIFPSWTKRKSLAQVMGEIPQVKNLSEIEGECDHHHGQNHNQHLTLLDLISIGVGGTVGSGIFVVAGMIARNYAGPATCLSFALSGMAALCSGFAYAEWAGRIPVAGSTYIYTYLALGEGPAVLAAACLTLEYAISGAAVARSWADKVVVLLNGESDGFSNSSWNVWAGFITLMSVLLLTVGVKESKCVTNLFTILKVMLVIFMMVGGFILFDSSNFHLADSGWNDDMAMGNTLPSFESLAPYGMPGVLRGATSSFFAFLGYDEVCCLANEAKNPRQDMPRAVLWTIAIVTILYILASLALVGMLPYDQISETSGFPEAFSSRGVEWAAKLSAAGEVITLPVVVLISLMAQPRLFAALAKDGILPNIFQHRNSKGNLVYSNLLSGIPMIVVATFIPFAYLDDCISVGILVAFNMTNSSLILMKCKRRLETTRYRLNSCCFEWTLSRHLVAYHLISFAVALVPRLASSNGLPNFLPLLCLSFLAGYALFLHRNSIHQPSFGSEQSADFSSTTDDVDSATTSPSICSSTFETPMVPLLPLVAIAINWYLVAQLEWTGLVLLLFYLGSISLLHAFSSRRRRSLQHLTYSSLRTTDDPDANSSFMMVAMSSEVSTKSSLMKNDMHPT